MNEKKSVLFIEDDAFLARIYVKTFEDCGFEVRLASNGEDGLKLAARDRQDLIILDILLPGMDGFEVLEKLKADPAVKDVPVIILSNLGQRDDVERATDLGAAGYMIKAHALPQEVARKAKEVLKIS